MFTENLFQYTAGTSGLGGCKERGQEEHDRWSQGQRTHTQRSDALLFSSLHAVPLSTFLFFIPYPSLCPFNTPSFLLVFLIHYYNTCWLLTLHPPVIGSSMQASCSCTPSSYSADGTRQPGLCSGGLVMMTTWSSRRNTCSPCKCDSEVICGIMFFNSISKV